ncbi:uncharacterized protein LOC142329167 isoform X4 [Lycorma delicatula]|uniref:uncharacterized protein LOC142329167 isoform X4 n=1 Tax=Lycorma delicatula TaxID=130591 RepID=UPI003F514B2B
MRERHMRWSSVRPIGGEDIRPEEMRKQPPQSKGKISTDNSPLHSGTWVSNFKYNSVKGKKKILQQDTKYLKVDKSGSPRVTLRLHQLKNREEKKDRGSNKNSTTDVAESYENSSSMESGGKSSTTNAEERELKESGNNSISNEENEGADSSLQRSETLSSEVIVSQPSAVGDTSTSEQQLSSSTSTLQSENNNNNNNTSNINISSSSSCNNNSNNSSSINNGGNNGNNSGTSNNNNNNINNSINTNSNNNSGSIIVNSNNNGSSSCSNNNNSGNGNNSSSNKRHVSTDDDDETRKKRRKEDSQSSSRGKSGSSTGGSPKSTGGGESEGEEGVKSVESPGPKVPPLKIVIPSLESEQGTRNGKSTTRHHQALPYVVARSEPGDTATTSSSSSSSSVPPSTSPPATAANNSDQDNCTSLSADEQQRSHQRVLRSSHRSGGGSSGAPSGSSSPVAPDNPSPQHVSPPPSEPTPSEPPPEEKPVDPPDPPPAPVDLHPRKRKLKPRDANPTSESVENTSSSNTVHPHEQPITNCYQLFLNIRKQIDRRRKGLFPVQPKPPQGFKDYLMNRCTYVLAGNASSRMTIPQVAPPASLQGGMKDLFIEQEKERYRLRMQHVIEKEKLVLSVEQEILRVHGRAARALANQALPFSACTILRDEEVYSAITPEQEEKDRNARSRYNGRLFLSWLQDVDDKWEKIKEAMLLRHHNEAESLHAVQKMDWEWKLKELGLCEFKARPTIEDSHVPMVHVSDDFDLLPA